MTSSRKDPSLHPGFLSYGEILLRHGSPDELLQLFHRATQCDVCLRQRNGIVMASTSSLFEERMRTYPRREVLRIFRHFLLDDGELILNCPIDVPPPSSTERALECLVLALKLLFDHQRGQLSVEQRYREQFVQDLLFSRIHSHEELYNRSNLYGWNLSGGVTVLVVDFGDNAMEQFFPAARQRFRTLFHDAIFSSGTHKGVFLIPNHRNRNVVQELQTATPTILEELGHNIWIGLGNERASFLEAGDSYQEACRAVEISKTFLHNRPIVFWSELGAYKLLSHLAGDTEAPRFIEEILGPLMRHDAEQNGDLLETLIAISEHNWKLKTAAQQLYVHYNTVKYRYKRIQELLDLTDEDSEGNFTVTLALKLYRMQQKPDSASQ